MPVTRRVRDLTLLTAVWAVLFAPGMFSADAAFTVDATQRANQLAASVIAPTFDQESAVIVRPCRDNDSVTDLRCDTVAAWLPAVAALIGFGWLSALRPWTSVLTPWPVRSWANPRAPPAI